MNMLSKRWGELVGLAVIMIFAARWQEVSWGEAFLYAGSAVVFITVALIVGEFVVKHLMPRE